MACILECGFYRASTNEIARRAGVTWGVIQHYFGTREKLMLAVLEHGGQTFSELVDSAEIQGDTTEERIGSLVDILCSHYANPYYLADLQVLLNLDHDPRTSVEVRKSLHAVATRSSQSMRRLIRDALGPAAAERDLPEMIFNAIRGFALSEQLFGVMSYDMLPPKGKEIPARQRRLFIQLISQFVDASARG